MKRLLQWLGLAPLIASLFLWGCDQPNSKTTTVVHADGSFDRTVEIQTPFDFPKHSADSHRLSHATKTRILAAIGKACVLPISGGRIFRAPEPPAQANLMNFAKPHAGWTIHKHYARGETAVHDVVKSPKGEAVLANEAYVHPLDNGRWEFVERYHWIGRPLPDSDFLCPPIRAVFKRCLGDGTPPSEVDGFTERFLKEYIDLVFDSRSSKTTMKSGRGAAYAKSLAGACRAAAEVRATPKIVDELAKMPKKESDKIDDFFLSRNWPFQTVAVDVRIPGQVFQTDAERDRKGYLTWSFVPVVAASKDVVLTVIYRP